MLAWIAKRGWQGKEADKRHDAFKFLLSWVCTFKKRKFPVNHLWGLKKFYDYRPRAEIVWTDDEIAHFCATAPEAPATAVTLARETGLATSFACRACI